MGIIWTIIIGFVAGLIAKFLHPGPNEPAGFKLPTILGIIGAFVATYPRRRRRRSVDRCRRWRNNHSCNLELSVAQNGLSS